MLSFHQHVVVARWRELFGEPLSWFFSLSVSASRSTSLKMEIAAAQPPKADAHLVHRFGVAPADPLFVEREMAANTKDR